MEYIRINYHFVVFKSINNYFGSWLQNVNQLYNFFGKSKIMCCHWKNCEARHQIQKKNKSFIDRLKNIVPNWTLRYTWYYLFIFTVRIVYIHCVKSIRIRSYGVSLRIQSECGKIRTRITPNTDTFCPMIWMNSLQNIQFAVDK